MKIKSKLICLFISYIVLGCAGPYTEKDNKSTIELSEDDDFQIQLLGDGQSDYAWQPVSKNKNIKITGLPIMKVIGKNKEYTFNFTTSGYGEDIIRLDYTNGTEIDKSYELRVIVGTMGRIISE